MNNGFDENRFEFEEDEYGVNLDSVDGYERQHKEECKRNSGFKRTFEDSLGNPIFGCPAKHVCVELDIEGNKQTVNYLEAIYKSLEKQVISIFS